jgi:glycosyltransferase involved in cell wall biosynthesis
MSYTSESEIASRNGTPNDRRTGVSSVSVVIPCFNEERHIGSVLRSLATQYPHDNYEIIVVDGQSTDRTREVIREFLVHNPGLRTRVIENPRRDIPTALNLGIRAAQGEVIVRMDAHSTPSTGYVRRCAELIAGNDAAVVGMPWRIQPGADTLMARAIALAVSHPFGIGDAQYRLKPTGPQFVDTVPFGVFRKTLWERLDGFNEDLLTNEDYDFNYRVRLDGGRILLDAREYCDYSARPTLGALARQYLRYGYWKAQMVKLQKRSLRWRHLVAPAFVLGLVSSFVVGWFWKPAWLALAVALGLYLFLALISAAQLTRRGKDVRLLLLLPLVFFTIHFVWGASFIVGLVRRPGRVSTQREIQDEA